MTFDFQSFVAKLKTRLGAPLPGALAHEPLRATPVGEVRPDFTHKLPPKPGSVLILLYPDEGTIKLPLTLRADYLGAHGGQISFPGGKREAGENEIENALRESREEINLDTNNIQVIGKLTDFFVMPSNFMVTPVIAVAAEKPSMIPDPREVAKIIECDISSLIGDDAIHTKEIIAARTFKMIAPHFIVEDEIVWGATAMMLNELRLVVKPLLI